MSKHPLDVVSLAFGTIFLVMALVGLAEAAEIIDEGLIVTLVGITLVAAMMGVVMSIRRISSEERPTTPPDGEPYAAEDTPLPDPADDDDPEPLRL